ncbi:MAG: chemotaxis response regulator protein-glutamate methylesterase [Actinomycetota bacterium]
MSGNAKILLVDDSAVIRGLLTKLIDKQPGMEVLSTAPNGRVGVEKARSMNPDLVVMDIEMPIMDGLEAVAEINKTHPKIPIVMFSTLTEKGATAALNALELGASDYATKPRNTGSMTAALEEVKDELVSKISALLGPAFNARGAGGPAEAALGAPSAAGPARKRRAVNTQPAAVVVGSSTGGPHALEAVLTAIRQPLPVPMFITQHMPETFTKVLAERLNNKCQSTVHEAEDGMVVQPGHCYIAPGGFHLSLEKQGTSVATKLLTTDPINSCRPSVEPMFETAAAIYGRRLVAVMLTGMGSDGLDGSRRIAGLGSPVVVQDEATSVVWGMPGAVAKAGLASEVLSLAEIGPRIVQLAGARPGTRRPQRATSGAEVSR